MGDRNVREVSDVFASFFDLVMTRSLDFSCRRSFTSRAMSQALGRPTIAYYH